MSLIILLNGARKFEFKWVPYAYQYRIRMNVI